MKKFTTNFKRTIATIALTAAVAFTATLTSATTASAHHICSEYKVTGTQNFLALRNEPFSADSNIIGEIYNGDYVDLVDKNTGSNGFWYVYSPSLDDYGYVKKSYLVEDCSYYEYKDSLYNNDNYTVSGTKHYLALRTAPYTSEKNEIGEIYNGDTVEVIDKNTGSKGFWYVYSPSLDDYGYVKCAYLN